MSLSTSFDDYLNPILVKEMRHLLRSNAFYINFIVFLFSIAGVALFLLAKPTVLSVTTGTGIIFAIIGLYGYGVIPNHLIDITKKNLKDETDALIAISTMPDTEISKGYLQFGLIQLTSLFAVSIPFVFVPIFIGQIDIQKLFILITISYLLCVIAVMWNAVASLKMRKNPESKTMTDIVFSGVQGLLATPIMIVYSYAIEGKILNNFSEASTWILAIVIIGVIFYFINFHSSSAKPETPKKLFTARVNLTIVWMLVIGLCLFFNRYMEAFFVIITLFICGYSLFIHSEPDRYSDSFIEEMPSNSFVKALKFPFVNGTVNGIVWLTIITIISCGIYKFIEIAFQPRLYIFKNLGAVVFACIATCNAYLFFGNFIRKVFFKKSKKSINALIAIILFICIGFLPSYVLSKPDRKQVGINTYITSYHGPFEPKNYPLAVGFWNPIAIAMFSKEGSTKAIVLSLFLIALGIVSNAKPLYKQATDYVMEIPEEGEDEDSEQ